VLVRNALRFLYDEKNETAYTWRIYFGDTFPSSVGHYTLTVEDLLYQDVLRAAVNGKVTTVKALNVQLTAFAADILRVAKDTRLRWPRTQHCSPTANWSIRLSASSS
jgi:hypothetical protein